MEYDREFDDNEWTPEELAQLRALTSERSPTDALKARTTSALRRRNLIGGRWSPGLRSVLALAASVVFVAGAVVGYAAGSRRALAPEAAAPRTETVARVDSSRAAQRQQTRQVIWF